jgi:hypothetical protein
MPALADEEPRVTPVLVAVDGPATLATATVSAAACNGLSIQLTAEEVEQLRNNLAAAAAELQADEQGSTGADGAGAAWVVVEQNNALSTAPDDPESSDVDRLREWV